MYKNEHLIMLYLLCFFVIISDFPKLFCATGSKMFKHIKNISKEWYSQILQHKQDVCIILQLLCSPFFREK